MTDLTAAHDLRSGYLPVGLGVQEVVALRLGDPGKLETLARATLVRHVRAMLALRERGAVVFDYGNNIRPHAATGGVPEALTIDIFTARYIRPLFCRGIGPFRWICLSGDDADLERDRRRSAWSCSPTSSGSSTGSRSRASTSPARVCRRGSPGSATASARGWRWPSTTRSPTGACAPRSRSPAITWTAAR